MKFAIVGLGRMGRSLAGRALERGHQVIGWDPSKGARAQAREQGLDVVESLQEIPGALPTPRVVLMWVPHGAPVDQNLDVLTAGLQAGTPRRYASLPCTLMPKRRTRWDEGMWLKPTCSNKPSALTPQSPTGHGCAFCRMTGARPSSACIAAPCCSPKAATRLFATR